MADTVASAFTALAAADVAAADLFPGLDMSEAGNARNKVVRADALLDALLRVAAAGSGITRDSNSLVFWGTRIGTADQYGRVQITDTDADGVVYFAVGRPALGWPHFSWGQDGNGLPLSNLRSTSDGRVLLQLRELAANSNPIALGSASGICWSSAANVESSGAGDTSLRRAAAGVVGVAKGGDNSAGGTVASVPLAASFTGTQNNYSPTNWPALTLHLTGTSTPVLTGLVAGVDGQEVRLVNVAATSIDVHHASSGSTALNRFQMVGGASITLAQHEIAAGYYDDTLKRWRLWKL